MLARIPGPLKEPNLTAAGPPLFPFQYTTTAPSAETRVAFWDFAGLQQDAVTGE